MKSKAHIQLILSMIIFGTLGIFVRNIPVSSGELALYRAVLASALIGCCLFARRERIPVRHMKKELILLLLSGAAMGFNWIFLFQAYKYTTVSIATLSYYFAPVIVTGLCPLLFREKLTSRQTLCFIMSTLGVALIIGASGFGNSGSDLVGISYGLGAAVLYAAVILLNKFIKNVMGIHRTFLQFLAALIVLIPYVSAAGGFHFMELDTSGWINLLIVGFVHSGLAYCLYFPSLQELKGEQAAVLSYIDPLVAVVVSVAVLGEPLTVSQVVGGALILGFALINEIALGISEK